VHAAEKMLITVLQAFLSAAETLKMLYNTKVKRFIELSTRTNFQSLHRSALSAAPKLTVNSSNEKLLRSEERRLILCVT